MDLTQGTFEEKRRRSKKMMLYFAIGSMIMAFAGLISAYIVSSSRPDWITDFVLPSSFVINLFTALASSITFLVARKLTAKGEHGKASFMLAITLLIGILFVFLQFSGFGQIIAEGYYFTGAQSNAKISFLYIIVAFHLAHVLSGLIAVVVVTIQHLRKKYTPTSMLGMELGEQFWHFLGIMWLVLFLFFYFLK
ncbi:cytochrome c oxidase subunit 3 [Spongiivirga citrea]|uniref:Heme-copper oxidase subunit III n=1 Tax=Spongiivirga citrea TaxID=1481457 RepID=A0A6M0CJW5_9FLAO|nr:cytochrome c oxidase subunit 3 [Spongiivirga citrea]NER18236.1 heme-copper oxidase subunit III [Spongiivirga citrea]